MHNCAGMNVAWVEGGGGSDGILRRHLLAAAQCGQCEAPSNMVTHLLHIHRGLMSPIDSGFGRPLKNPLQERAGRHAYLDGGGVYLSQ